MVVDAALGAIVNGFGLDGVLLTADDSAARVPDRQTDLVFDTAGDATFVAAKLPPSWSADSALLFEVYGNLWWLLRDHGPSGGAASGRNANATRWRASAARMTGTSNGSDHWQTALDSRWLWICRINDGDDVVAAAAIRPEPFKPEEAETMASLIQAVVGTFSGNESRVSTREQVRMGTRTALKYEGRDIRAEVTAEWDPETVGQGSASNGGRQRHRKNPVLRRIGSAKAADPATAVARAAAKACRPRCQVTFAGSSEVDDAEVTIVMINGPDCGLRMGFAVRPIGDKTGAAEAVFTAASW